MTQSVLNFKLEFSEEEVTPYAGLGIYGEMYRAIGMDKEVKREFPGPGSGAGFEANSYVSSILMMMIGGGKYIEDIRKIKVDEGLRRICKMEEAPSGDAVGDWLRRESKKKLMGLKRIHKNFSRRILKRAKEEEFTLDIDATEIEANKWEAEYTYKGQKGYMPIMGFLVELDWCIGYEFREGNVPPAGGNYEFTKEIVEFVERNGKRIRRFRSDSAAYQAQLMNDLNRRGTLYTITADRDVSVKEAIGSIPRGEWKQLKDRDGNKTDREYAELIHSMNETDHAFRIVVQRWKNPQRELFEQSTPYYYGIATNYSEEEKDGEEVIHWHNERGNSENYNKEVKIGFNLDYLPCGEFEANGVWFGLGILAYNLFIASKMYLFPESWLKKTIRTVRWQFIQMAGRVIRRSRYLILRVCSVWRETYEIYKVARQKCWDLKESFT